jgi:hypothetical protein
MEIYPGDIVTITRNISQPSTRERLSGDYYKEESETLGKIIKKFMDGYLVEVGDHEFFIKRKEMKLGAL